MMYKKIEAPHAWSGVLEMFWRSDAAEPLKHQLASFLAAEGMEVFPPRPQWLRALAFMPPAGVRVVVLGQDPYHGPGQADGLAFSIPRGVRLPPSLRNILGEVLPPSIPKIGCPLFRAQAGESILEPWARQGVLLLNAILTVEPNKPASHRNWGWQALTDYIIRYLAMHSRNVVFMLWGGFAQSKLALIQPWEKEHQHRVLMANHPSPLSARRLPVPFVGSRPFEQANAFFEEHDLPPVNWFSIFQHSVF